MTIDKTFVDKFVNVTSKAAIASYSFVGKKLTITATPTYIAASVIKDNKLAQYSSIVIEFGALKAFCIMS